MWPEADVLLSWKIHVVQLMAGIAGPIRTETSWAIQNAMLKTLVFISYTMFNSLECHLQELTSCSLQHRGQAAGASQLPKGGGIAECPGTLWASLSLSTPVSLSWDEMMKWHSGRSRLLGISCPNPCLGNAPTLRSKWRPKPTHAAT